MVEDTHYDEEPFIIGLPAWTIADLVLHRSAGLPYSAVIMNSDPLGRFVPIFTDDDLATRFIEDGALEGITAVALDSFRALRFLLTDKEAIGVENVGVDVSFKPPKRGRFWPIHEVLQDIAASEETPPS
jgi:hypothetical protein